VPTLSVTPELRSVGVTRAIPNITRPVTLLVAFCLTVLAAVAVGPVAPAGASTAELHSLLAQTRASKGLPALTRSASLDSVAQNWTAHMASTNTLAHNPRMSSQIPSGWTVAGENVGYAWSATQVHQAWLGSAGHYANIVSRDYNAVGIGFVKTSSGKIWATQVFARYSTVPQPVRTTVPRTSRLSDLSIDGRADVVSRDSAGALWVYPGSGKRTLLTRRQLSTGWNGMTAIATPGDTNRDGYSDIYARDSLGRLWLYPGNAYGKLSARTQVGSGWSGIRTIVTPGDFDGNGIPDVLGRDSTGRLHLFSGNGRDSAGNLLLYRGNGRGGWGAMTRVGTGWSGMTSIVVAGDFSGDRLVDVVARDRSGALWVYPGNGKGGLTARSQMGSGWSGMTSIS
jgi:uncharacterized protein YkwD